MGYKKSKPIPFEAVYKQFRESYPLTRDKVMHWCPRDHLTITLYLEGGLLATYNYIDRRLRYLKERWME